MTWDNTENRKPTIRERIQMDWQHDMWNSKIKFWLVILSGLITGQVLFWGWIA